MSACSLKPPTRQAKAKTTKRKKPKKKPIFDDTDNTSDFVSCDSSTNATSTTSGIGSQEAGFDFLHRTSEREDQFDKWEKF